jgi:hypothetical protein
MSWRTTLTVLTVLTALTLVARFSTPELILIVRVPARPPSARGYFDAQHASRADFPSHADGQRGRWDVLASIVTGQTVGGAQKVRGRSHPLRGGVEYARPAR